MKNFLFFVLFVLLSPSVFGLELKNDALTVKLDAFGNGIWHLNEAPPYEGDIGPEDMMVAKEEYFTLVFGADRTRQSALKVVASSSGERFLSFTYLYGSVLITKTFFLNRENGFDIMYDIYNNGSLPYSFSFYEYADLDVPSISETSGPFLYQLNAEDRSKNIYLSGSYNDAMASGNIFSVSDYGSAMRMAAPGNALKKGIVFNYPDVFGNDYLLSHNNTDIPYLRSLFLSDEYSFFFNGFRERGFSYDDGCSFTMTVERACELYPDTCYADFDTFLFSPYSWVSHFANSSAVLPYCRDERYSCSFLTTSNELVHDYEDCFSVPDYSKRRKDLKDPKVFAAYDVSLGAYASRQLLFHFDYDAPDEKVPKAVDVLVSSFNHSLQTFSVSNAGNTKSGLFSFSVFSDTFETYHFSADIGAHSSQVFSLPVFSPNVTTIFISLDTDDSVHESDEKNNFYSYAVSRLRVKLEVESAYPSLISDYIQEKVTTVSFVDSDYDVLLSINVSNDCSLGYCLQDDYISYFGSDAYEPFVGLVSRVNDTVFIYGVGISGLLAGVKEFATDPSYYFTSSSPRLLRTIEGVAIYDFFLTHPLLNDSEKIYRGLHGVYDVTDVHFISNKGVLLRAVNMKSSSRLQQYWGEPVVLAGGLWSNISAWQSFGGELADSGRDVFLIELTGGPYTDCSSCFDYAYSDLVTDFYPAVIGGIQSLRNGSSLAYVGHSNGARVGISSLELFNENGLDESGYYFDGMWRRSTMSSSPISTYVAVGVPGSFENKGVLHGFVNYFDDEVLENLANLNRTHISFDDVFYSGFFNVPPDDKIQDAKISYNLFSAYLGFIQEDNDLQIGKNLNLDTFAVIQGAPFVTHDLIVTTKDESEIYHNVDYITRKVYLTTHNTHMSMVEKEDIQKLTKKVLNKQRFTPLEQFSNVLDERKEGPI